MRKHDLLPHHVQRLIDAKEKREVAKSMAIAEKPVNDALDAFYTAKSSFRDEVDCGEINNYMELR